MATLNMNSSMTVGELKKQFREAFGSSLRVYKGGRVADDTLALSEIGLKADGTLECRSSLTVAGFISRMMNDHGLKVKVYTCDEWVACLDGLTLESTGKVKKNAVKADMESMIAYQRQDKEESVDDEDKDALSGYKIVAEDNGGYSVYKNGTLCENAKGAMREIAALIGFGIDPNWTTRQLGAKLLKAMNSEEKEEATASPIGECVVENVTIISLDEPGSLEQYFNSKALPLDSIRALSIHGHINEEDASFIRWNLSPIYLDLQNVPLEKIEDFMFDGLDKMETIILPPSVKSIGDSAFRGCKKLNYLNIPSGVKEISDFAFENCTNLNHLSVSPDNQHFKMIQNCLVSQSEPTIILWGHGNTIPTGMSSIEYGEYSCGGYKSLFIPDSFYVSKGGLGIANRESLISVHVNTTHPHYVEKDNSLLNKDESVLLMGTNTSIIPNTVRTIACRAFIGCESLDKISIPESVEIIDEFSFYGCKSLPEITIPGSVKEIKEYAFFECENLKHIVLSEGIVTIGKAAFGGCKNIESIVIPSTVETIDREAFGWCYNLKEVTLLCPIPPQLGEYALDSDVKIHIPRGTKKQYESTNWGKFNLDELS